MFGITRKNLTIATITGCLALTTACGQLGLQGHEITITQASLAVASDPSRANWENLADAVCVASIGDAVDLQSGCVTPVTDLLSVTDPVVGTAAAAFCGATQWGDSNSLLNCLREQLAAAATTAPA